MAKKKGRKRQQKKLQQAGEKIAATEGQGAAGGQDEGPDDGQDEGEDEGPEDGADAGPSPGATAASAPGASPAPASPDAPASPLPTAPGASPAAAAGGPAPSPEKAVPEPLAAAVAGAPSEVGPEKDAKGDLARPPEPELPAVWPARLVDYLTEQFEFSSLYAWVLISVVVFAAYANSLWVPFLFDDAPVITRNRNFRRLDWEHFVDVVKTPPITRCLTNLTFYANYQIAGTPAYQIADPNSPYRGTYGPTWTYHVFNMALHSFNGILLFSLLQMLLAGVLTGSSGVRSTAARRASLTRATGPPEVSPFLSAGLTVFVPGMGHFLCGRVARGLAFVALQAAIVAGALLIPQEDWKPESTSLFNEFALAALVLARLGEVASAFLVAFAPIPEDAPAPAEPVAPIASWVALGGTLLWLVHPVQTMAVTYISQRYAMCGAAAFLGTLLCYVSLRRRIQEGTAWLESHWTTSVALLLGTFGCYFLCFVTKENSTIAPFVIVALELTFFARPAAGAVGESLPPTLVRWAIPGTLVGLFVFLALAGMAKFGMVFLLPERCPTFPNRMSYFQTEWVVILKYLRLYALPDQLSMEQAFPGLAWSAKEAHELHLQAEPWEMIKALVGHALILALAVKWWLSGRRFLTFAVAWFYITLGPESTLVPILDPMVEHRLYLPSCALAAGVAYVLGRAGLALYELGPSWTRTAAASFAGVFKSMGLAETTQELLEGVREWVFERRQSLGAGALGLLAALVALLGFGTFLRNRVYTPTGIWQDAIAKRPDCARAYSSLGMEFLYQEDWVSSVEPIEAALYLGPYHVEGWNNIGKAYLEIGSAMPNGPRNLAISPPLEWAAYALNRGIEVNDVAPSPSVPLCYNNLGLTYLKMAERLGKDPESERKKAELEKRAAVELESACAIDRGYETAWINLGSCLVKQAERVQGPERRALARKAIQSFASSHATDPRHQLFPLCGRNLAQAYRQSGLHGLAYRVYTLLNGQDDAGWGEIMLSVLADEAASAAEEMTDIDVRMDGLRQKGDKDSQDDLGELQTEKLLLGKLDPELERTVTHAEKAGEACVKKEPTFAARLFHSAGRYWMVRDPSRGRPLMERAYQLASKAEKEAWEKEARERGFQIRNPGPVGPGPGPQGPGPGPQGPR